MRVSRFPVTEAAPLASDGSIVVSFIQLNVLDRVSERLLVDSGTSNNVGVYFNNR